MRAYPLLKEEFKFDAKKQIAFLDRCLKVSPYNEAAWLELARLAKSGELPASLQKDVLAHVDSTLQTFSKYPDFTWKVVPDLIEVQPDREKRNKVFERLVGLYEGANRPDLAFEARLKWTEYLCEKEKWKTAAMGLSQSIYKFPKEGRYVPRMMDRLKQICASYKGGTADLGQFYLKVLQMIPPKRGSEPSHYCISMFQQAIAFFRENNNAKVATQLENQLQLLRASKAS